MHFSSKSRRILGLLTGVSFAAVASPGLAQEAEIAGGLTDIVVTAQKREQNLQDVPLAISAISAEKVEKLDIRDSRDLSGLAPNVTIVQGTTNPSAAVISIRGIPTPAAETFGLDTANALYVDGIYIARSGASALDVSDIERVEVLRGPQGTLFGRNTTGGAIAFISRKPSKELRVKAEAGYGNYSAWNGRITVDPGEIAGIATSFSYAHRQRNGTVDNILQADDSKDPGAFKADAFRAAARMELGGTGSFQYIFDYSKNAAATAAFQLTNVWNGSVRAPIVVNGTSLVTTQPAPVGPFLAGVTYAQPQCAALATPTRAYRDTVCNDISGNAVNKMWGHNLQAENDFETFKVKLTAGYRIWHNESITDLDGIGGFTARAFTNASLLNGLPAALLGFIPSLNPPAAPAGTAAFVASQPVPTLQQNLFDTSNVRRHRQFSTELEFSGDTDTLDWVVGGFYFWEKGSENNPQNSAFVLDTNQIFIANFGGLGPSFAAANPARYRAVLSRTPLVYTASAESKALYGQFTLYPGGRDSGLRLTAGGRYTWDSKHMLRQQNGATPFATPQIGDASYSRFTWNLMLGYDIADGITTYARVATGYRSGGFNAGEANATGKLTSFGAENVTAYEIGLKTELFNRRVRFNLAGYHNVYKDLAVSIPVPAAAAGSFATIIGNAGKVNYTGFEAELQAVLTENFSVDGSIGYVDIKYKEFNSGQAVGTNASVNIASIVTPGYTSPLTANIAANARFPLNWGGAELTARVGYTYEDGKYSFNNNISVPFNEALKGDNRNLVDAQIAIEKVPLGGAEGTLRFWGKNITNGHDFVRGVDFGPLGFAGGYFADPATYGVTVGVKF
jgi:iron complex outermembrane receptor protein